jgi:hypothetical protein
MVVQTAESEWLTEAAPDITYGAIAAGPQRYFSPSIAASDAGKRLQVALERRHRGVVLVSTTKLEHLRQLAEAAAMSKS